MIKRSFNATLRRMPLSLSLSLTLFLVQHRERCRDPHSEESRAARVAKPGAMSLVT